jgi:hypothetical protein
MKITEESTVAAPVVTDDSDAALILDHEELT